MSSDEPPSYSSDNGSGAEESPPGPYSPTPGICGQCEESVGEISWKLGDQPSRISHNFNSRVEQTSTHNTLNTHHTHLFSASVSLHLLKVPLGLETNRTGGQTDRQTDSEGGEEGGRGICCAGTVTLLCTP